MVWKRHIQNLGVRGGASSQNDKAQKGIGTVEEFFFWKVSRNEKVWRNWKNRLMDGWFDPQKDDKNKGRGENHELGAKVSQEWGTSTPMTTTGSGGGEKVRMCSQMA